MESIKNKQEEILKKQNLEFAKQDKKTNIFTFHSFCYLILTENNLSFLNYQLLKDKDKTQILEKIVTEKIIFGFKISELAKNISIYKKDLISQKIIQSKGLSKDLFLKKRSIGF